MVEPTFGDRHFLASQGVYEAIQRGEIQGTDAVEAALMEVQLEASDSEQQ